MTAVLIAKDRVDLQSRHVADQSSVVPLSEVGCQSYTNKEHNPSLRRQKRIGFT